MNKLVEVDGRRYFYCEDGTYTEAGKLVPEGEALVLHFRYSGRNPLASARFSDILKDDQFSRLDLFLDNLPEGEREDQIRKAIKQIENHIKFLPQTNLDGNNRIEREIAYEKQIKALNQRLEGGTDKDWSRLFNNLGKYISDTTPLKDFNFVMNNKTLPYKKDKLVWTGKKTEAMYFQKEKGFTVDQFKKCFIHTDGKEFHEHNRTETSPKQSFIDIINNE